MKEEEITQQWLIEKRTELGESLEAFYARVGYSRATGCRIENGTRDVNSRMQKLFLNEFNTQKRSKK